MIFFKKVCLLLCVSYLTGHVSLVGAEFSGTTAPGGAWQDDPSRHSPSIRSLTRSTRDSFLRTNGEGSVRGEEPSKMASRTMPKSTQTGQTASDALALRMYARHKVPELVQMLINMEEDIADLKTLHTNVLRFTLALKDRQQRRENVARATEYAQAISTHQKWARSLQRLIKEYERLEGETRNYIDLLKTDPENRKEVSALSDFLETIKEAIAQKMKDLERDEQLANRSLMHLGNSETEEE